MHYFNGETCEINKINFQPNRPHELNVGSSVPSTGTSQSLEQMHPSICFESSPLKHPVSLTSLSHDKPLDTGYGSSTTHVSEHSHLNDPTIVHSLSIDNHLKEKDKSSFIPVSEVKAIISSEPSPWNDPTSVPPPTFSEHINIDEEDFTAPVSEPASEEVCTAPVLEPASEEVSTAPMSDPASSFTLFYCKEGCFSDKSKCTHQRVNLPLFVMHS